MRGLMRHFLVALMVPKVRRLAGSMRGGEASQGVILLQARSRGFEACTCNWDCMQSCGKRGCEHPTRDSIGITIDALPYQLEWQLGR